MDKIKEIVADLMECYNEIGTPNQHYVKNKITELDNIVKNINCDHQLIIQCMNIIKTDYELQDFACPHCNKPIEDDSEYVGNYEFKEYCPWCGKQIVIEMRKVTHLEYSVKLP